MTASSSASIVRLALIALLFWTARTERGSVTGAPVTGSCGSLVGKILSTASARGPERAAQPERLRGLARELDGDPERVREVLVELEARADLWPEWWHPAIA
jgi:hypothetical protein